MLFAVFLRELGLSDPEVDFRPALPSFSWSDDGEENTVDASVAEFARVLRVLRTLTGFARSPSFAGEEFLGALDGKRLVVEGSGVTETPGVYSQAFCRPNLFARAVISTETSL